MTNLATTVQTLERTINTSNRGGRGTRGGRGARGGRGGRGALNTTNIFGRHPRWHRSNVSRYCWSHGACNHNSSECNNPLPGHQNAAIFENRMGGCNHYCTPVVNDTNSSVNPYINSLSINSTNTNTVITKGDSAVTKNYWRPEDKHILYDCRPIDGQPVTIPDGSTISPTEEGDIPISPLLSPTATKAAVMLQLKSSSLISLGQLADDDCKIFLDKKQLLALKNNNIILKGWRNSIDGLWDIPVHKSTITPNNYTLPTIHPALYSSRLPTQTSSQQKYPSSTPTKKYSTYLSTG